VEQTLRLMRQPADSVVDEDLGRDICRFSGVRALILPRIIGIGDAFELQAAIVDPQTGRHVEQIRVTALGREEVLLDAIDELTREVRSRLGESLESIQTADFPVSDVTTSSWEALHYFAKANETWGRFGIQDAIRFYELALALDPQFATCRGSLGLILIQFGNDVDRGRAELRQALADGETLPRNEYLMLRAVNRQFVDGDLEGALGEYELVNELYPDNMASYNNRGRILMQLERFDEAVAMYKKAAELDGQSAFPIVNLAFMYTMYSPDASAAEEVCDRLIALDPENANYHSLQGWAQAVQLRFDDAQASLERAVEIDPDHAFAVPNLGYTLMAAGNPERATFYLRQNLVRIRESDQGGSIRGAVIDLVVALSAAGETEQASELVDEAVIDLEERMAGREWSVVDHAYLAQLYAAAGRTEGAERQFELAKSLEVDDAASRFELARCCAVLGHRVCAIENTRLALEMGFNDPYLPLLIPSMNRLIGDPEFLALFPNRGPEAAEEQ